MQSTREKKLVDNTSRSTIKLERSQAIGCAKFSAGGAITIHRLVFLCLRRASWESQHFIEWTAWLYCLCYGPLRYIRTTSPLFSTNYGYMSSMQVEIYIRDLVGSPSLYVGVLLVLHLIHLLIQPVPCPWASCKMVPNVPSLTWTAYSSASEA